MIRKIIQIDEAKCNGCGLCAQACHEGAIAIVDGKARLMRDDYCDGLGDCLPACPMNAIAFVEREASAYDAAAVEAHKQKQAAQARMTSAASALTNWPVQIKLAAIRAPFFANAQLLIAADCTAYAYGAFHADLMAGRATLVGCPKLDGIDYAEKLTEIFRENVIAGITLTRMEVPCCGGLEFAVKRAIAASGKQIPLRVVTISIDGKILADEQA